MFEFSLIPTWLNVAAFAMAGVVIVVAGVRMSGLADRLADITGLGEATTGAVLLGASTSLSGIVTSVTAAASGHPELAISNAAGGTLFRRSLSRLLISRIGAPILSMLLLRQPISSMALY